MVETPRLQAKIKTAILPKVMSQYKLDKIPLIFSRFQPINEPTVFKTVVVQFQLFTVTGWYHNCTILAIFREKFDCIMHTQVFNFFSEPKL